MTINSKQFATLDKRLSWLHFPRLGPWWMGQLGRFLDHQTARDFAVRVGRGGAKSTVLRRFALGETLFGKWRIPKGERHYFVLVSVSKDEASAGLTLLESYLRALAIPFDRVGDTIELRNLPRGIKVLACQLPAVVGFRCFGFGCDELTKWRSADDGANPAKEVVASLRAMTVTHPGARAMFVSSPLGLGDFHSSLVDAGDTNRQIVAQAPTWVANPMVTEKQTHELEPDQRVWKREYLAVPQSGALSAFGQDDIAHAFRARDDIDIRSERVLVIDASSGKKDRFTFGIAGWAETEGGAPVLVFDEVGGFNAAQVREAGIDSIIATIARRARAAGASSAFGDQRESMMLESALADHGLDFTELPWTSASKPRGVARVRRWLLEHRLALPQHAELERELLNFEERVDAGGQFTFGARGSGHDDFVALLVTLALADEEQKLSGSPLTTNPRALQKTLDELNRSAPKRRWVHGYADTELAEGSVHGPMYVDWRGDVRVGDAPNRGRARSDALGDALGASRTRGRGRGYGAF